MDFSLILPKSILLSCCSFYLLRNKSKPEISPFFFPAFCHFHQSKTEKYQLFHAFIFWPPHQKMVRNEMLPQLGHFMPLSNPHLNLAPCHIMDLFRCNKEFSGKAGGFPANYTGKVVWQSSIRTWAGQLTIQDLYY